MMSSMSSNGPTVLTKQKQCQEMYSDIYQNIQNLSANNRNSSQSEPNCKSSRMSISHAKGLLNMPGQNNCFLNSAVQVLWHLDVFRRSFRELSGHACMADSCIFCALKELFNQFQYSQESALPPDALRFALAEAFSDQRRFQLGFMDDAAECFENILLRIHCHIANQDSEEMCSTTHCLPHCIPHQKFAMNLIEQIICHSCGATSDPFPFTQMVHYVSTPALCAQAKQYDCEIGLTFGELLKSAGAVGDIRDCPRSCGARIQIKKSLINKPDIVSIGLVWDSERPTLNHIMDVFRAIGTTLRLPDVFDSVSECRPAVSTVLQLVGLVTYYGKHYSTFFFHTKLREWIYFDDAAVRAIGPQWKSVVDKCIRGHFQPLLLLYANPNGTAVNTEMAPKECTPLIVKKSNRRPFLGGLPAKCDITTNNYHSLQNAQRNGTVSTQSTHITSDSETNNRSIDKKNVSNIMRQISGQNQINKPYSSKQRSEQTYSNINTGLVKPTVNTFVANNNKMRPNHINTLQHNSGLTSGSDVPDSPSGMSSISYFSDIGELDNRYISRKAVESILSLQRHSLKKNAGNRNSSSSLDSFDIRNGALVFNKSLVPTDKSNYCSLQRNDSGNSSGDRHSASSASVSSVDSTFFTFANHKRRPILSNFANQRHPPSPKLSSDGGYDSFSLSSSDSYPSVNSNGCAAKMNRLKQIPEDVQLMELINTSTMLDCDKLCNAADVLLLKSHEKEREGDLRAAAALSDSAASRARSAMDAPYSNHQTLITARMKHSMCVMRSASLHKRLNELEAEEKRRIKEQLSASTGVANHSRQGSRDSTHSKHSRQGSKDGKDTKNKEPLTTKHASLDFTKMRPIEGSLSAINAGKTLELYATLPKKGSKKKFLQQSFNTLASLRIKSDDSNIYRDVISKRDSVNSISAESMPSTQKKKTENNKLFSNNKTKNCVTNNQNKQNISETDDYYSEWEATRRSQQSVQRTFSGSASCKENDSEYYGEVGAYTTQSTGKKQHRVRRKLLMGGFMKRKNRSLPDLREGAKTATNDSSNGSQDILSDSTEKEPSNECKSIAQISAKGFHQTHRAFISERGLYQRPSLLKVNPPLIDKTEQTYESVSNTYSTLKVVNTPKIPPNHMNNNQFSASSPSPPPPTPPKAKVSAVIESKPNETKIVENSFLKEIASKRAEIMRNSIKENGIDGTGHSTSHSTGNTMSNGNPQTQKELINHVIPQNYGSNIKPVLKSSLTKHNINVENDNRVDYESINLKVRTPPHPYPQNSQINQIPNSISKSVSSPTQMTSPKIAEQTDESNASNRSVKDLTSRFEKIMNKNENSTEKSNESITDAMNETKRLDKTDSLSSSGHRIVAQLMPNKTSEEPPNGPKPITQPVLETNKAENYSVQSPTTIQSPISANCLAPGVRPNRPPDYQTAMKRIGMLRNDKCGQQSRSFYMNVSGNIIQSRNSPQIQSQLNEQQKSVTQKPITSTEVSKQLSNNKIPINCEEKQNSLTRKKNIFKKSVSFSDQVVLVACAEEDQEEHLPNPILERVLAKNNMSFSPQSP